MSICKAAPAVQPRPSTLLLFVAVLLLVPLATVSLVSTLTCQKLPPPRMISEALPPRGILGPAVTENPWDCCVMSAVSVPPPSTGPLPLESLPFARQALKSKTAGPMPSELPTLPAKVFAEVLNVPPGNEFKNAARSPEVPPMLLKPTPPPTCMETKGFGGAVPMPTCLFSFGGSGLGGSVVLGGTQLPNLFRRSTISSLIACMRLASSSSCCLSCLRRLSIFAIASRYWPLTASPEKTNERDLKSA